MKSFFGAIRRICFINDECDDSVLILWDEATPWDGPTEWS
jgi:hypothetical protein